MYIKRNTDLYAELTKYPYFTTEFVKSLYVGNKSNATQLITRWLAQKKLLSIKRGFYTTKAFVNNYYGDFPLGFAYSSIIDPLSYVSAESVLSFHNMLSEPVYVTTAVSTKKTKWVTSAVSSYHVRSISPLLYLGFEPYVSNGLSFYVATKAKALFDFFYYKRFSLNESFNVAEEFRLNLFKVDTPDYVEFAKYVSISKSSKMLFVYNSLRKYE